MKNLGTVLWKLISLPIRHHFWGSFAIMLVISAVIGDQILDRHNFANVELHRDVMERWGAPIDQPAPSVRYVKSAAVFTKLAPLPLSAQTVRIDAAMNYRKRGLVYFSGFDFSFTGSYRVENPHQHDIDAVFVFPVSMERNKVLLSELTFIVNGEPAAADLSETGDKLVWTGRLKAGAQANFKVRFQGRGLDSFVYRLDPASPVRNFKLAMNISGGENFDYPLGVVPAHHITGTASGLSPVGVSDNSEPDAGSAHSNALHLNWNYPSLESGVPVGAVLPSEKSFDHLISTMLGRAWLPFICFFMGLVLVAAYLGRQLRFFESYLMACIYGFFFVLVAYFAAFMNFYLAFALATLVSAMLIVGYGWRLFGIRGRNLVAALAASFLLLPSTAVLIQGYTGLIYTIEILSGLITLIIITTRGDFIALLEEVGFGRDEMHQPNTPDAQ